MGVVGMRRLKDGILRALLNHPPILHDDHVIRNRAHHRHIMGDKDVGNPQLALQPQQ